LDNQKTLTRWQRLKPRSPNAENSWQIFNLRPELFFAGSDFDHRLMFDKISEKFAGMELIGCNTAGEFTSSCGFSDDPEILKLENRLLKRKLDRSEPYRGHLEEINDFNSAMHRKIIQEVESVRQEIQRKDALLRKSEEKYRRIVTTAGEVFRVDA